MHVHVICTYTHVLGCVCADVYWGTCICASVLMESREHPQLCFVLFVCFVSIFVVVVGGGGSGMCVCVKTGSLPGLGLGASQAKLTR